jgi:hypothetical protein
MASGMCIQLPRVIDTTLPPDLSLSHVVHYERGGIAHSFRILVARLTKDDVKPKVVWRAVGGPLKDYAAFLDALRSGKLDDRLDYAH